MARRTSIDAYRRIEADGLLSARRFQVYRALYHHGPATRNELSDILQARWNIRINPNLVSSRLNELRSLGVVYEATERTCTQTGMRVILWDVTEAIPTGKATPVSTRHKCQTCNGKGWLPGKAAHPSQPMTGQLALFA